MLTAECVVAENLPALPEQLLGIVVNTASISQGAGCCELCVLAGTAEDS